MTNLFVLLERNVIRNESYQSSSDHGKIISMKKHYIGSDLSSLSPIQNSIYIYHKIPYRIKEVVYLGNNDYHDIDQLTTKIKTDIELLLATKIRTDIELLLDDENIIILEVEKYSENRFNPDINNNSGGNEDWPIIFKLESDN